MNLLINKIVQNVMMLFYFVMMLLVYLVMLFVW